MIGPVDIVQSSSQDVREDTAELASLALSDVISIRSHSPPRQYYNNDSYFFDHSDEANRSHHNPIHPDVIQETSEPPSPERPLPFQKSTPTSALAEMIRGSPPGEEDDNDGDESEDISDHGGTKVVTVSQGIISQPDERTNLLRNGVVLGYGRSSKFSSISDLESQNAFRKPLMSGFRTAVSSARERGRIIMKRLLTPQVQDIKAFWTHGLRQPIRYIPSVILGLLLNILDALSYGEIKA